MVLGKDAARRFVRSGPRTVLLTATPGPRLGNFLYFWLHAHRVTKPDAPYQVRLPSYMLPWLDVFPRLAALSTDRPRLRDRREWPTRLLFQEFGVDFTATELEAFIRDVLLPSRVFQQRSSAAGSNVVINVRRGDYYSNPDHRRNFGFDVVDYLQRSISLLRARREITTARVISDDPRWCSANIASVLNSTNWQVSYGGSPDPVEMQFAELATAPLLVGANSTFSYWGAYVGAVLHGSDHEVIMPTFHSREVNDGLAYQLDPRWTALPVQPEHG